MSGENVCSCGHHVREHKDDGNAEQYLTSAPLTKKCTKSGCSCTSFHSRPIKIETSEPKKHVLLEKKDPSKLLETLKISKADYDNDEIIQLLVDGHIEGDNYEIKSYRKINSPDPKTIPIDDLKGIISEDIIKGLTAFWSKDKDSVTPGLMKFQRETIDKILDDKHTIISSPTGTGKTEAFIIPIIEKILNPRGLPPTAKDGRKSTHALLVYPRVALVDDQADKIIKILEYCNLSDKITVGRLHSKIQGEPRDQIRESRPEIFACTFSFINWHLITKSKIWEELIKPAKMLVMDESHSYTSYEGSNVHHLLKRMKQKPLADMKLQYIASSATLHNPEEFFKTMFDLQEEEIGLIQNEERRERNLHEFFIMPNNQNTTMKNIIIAIASRKAKEADRKHQMIAFSDSHDNAEILAENVVSDSKGKVEIQPHHSAIRDRRIIEKLFKAGDIDVLSCTPTLELGIDIGSVDAVITTFTNDHDKFVQRIGRAGRKGQTAYGISVFNQKEPSSNYYSTHIDEYLAQKHEVKIQTDNPIMHELHEKAEKAGFANCADIARDFPFIDSSQSVRILHEGKEIGKRTIPVGFYKLHPHAIVRNGLKHYRVESLNKENGEWVANLKESPDDKYKRTMYSESKSVTLLKATEKDFQLGSHDPDSESGFSKDRYTIKTCDIEIHHKIYGYDEGRISDDRSKMDKYTLENPHEWTSKHSAVRIVFPNLTSNGKDSKLHTIIHLLDNASKIITKAEADDIQDAEDETQSGEFYLYDDTANGQNGYSELIFKNFKQILEKAKELVNECDCEKADGCPKCTFTTSRCPTYNEELDKAGAKEFFNNLELS